jgi:hypothetical protein
LGDVRPRETGRFAVHLKNRVQLTSFWNLGNRPTILNCVSVLTIIAAARRRLTPEIIAISGAGRTPPSPVRSRSGLAFVTATDEGARPQQLQLDDASNVFGM